MPMSRYEIRNEYSLADPDLYRAADKDDPEALLEGVAMAGIVGVLRQLGDLAEFAAEIFHDLHEEVIATAARGHDLMIRVQQLETEVPSIEKAFLSQTDHSSFFYSAGVECHPNLQLDQNLITQGDLPRFVMDSYEECRGPPRLFLLDKFDVAGAGACLKRYTDPSFFKVENPTLSGVDVPREKKIRKAKKKGPRWRNGETPECLPSHAKLHQLFLDEPVENGVRNPARRVKLKRRLNGFPFDSKTGKSYMEKILKSPSPEHKMIHEITVSSPLRLPANNHNENDLEVLEVRSVSPSAESVGRKRSPPSDREEAMLNPFKYETDEVSTSYKICEVPNSYLSTLRDGISSTLDEEPGERDIAVSGERKIETSLTGYQSDEVVSETDNYVDAPSTIDSEMDTDSEWRAKNDFSSSYNKSQSSVSVENEEQLHSQSSESQSNGEFTMSDEGNNSSRKEVSSFVSLDSPRISSEVPQSEEMSAEEFPSADAPEIVRVDASCYKNNANKTYPVDHPLKPMASNNILIDSKLDLEQLSSTLCRTGSTPILLRYGSERVARKGRSKRLKSDETVSTSDDEEKKRTLITNNTCCPNVTDSKSQPRDESPRSSSVEYLVDEPNGEDAPSMSYVSDAIWHFTDSSAAISGDLLDKDDSGREGLSKFESMDSMLNVVNVLSHSRTDHAEIISTENSIPGKLDDEALKIPENFPSEYADIDHNGDRITSIISEGDELDSNGVSDVNFISCGTEPSHGHDLVETTLINVEAEHHSNSSSNNQVSSETLIFPHTENPPDGPQEILDAHDRDAISDEEPAVSETPELRTLKSSEIVELQGTGIVDDVSEIFVAPESSCHSLEKYEDPAGTFGTAVKDGFNLHRGSTGLEATESSNAQEILDTHDRDAISDEEPVVSETPELGTPKSSEVVELSGTGIAEIATSDIFVAPESSCYTLEKHEDPAHTLGAAVNDGLHPHRGSSGLEITEISFSDDPKSLNAQETLDTHSRDAISDKEPVVSETPELGTLKSCEAVELQGIEITNDAKSDIFVAPESLCYTLEKKEDPAGTLNAAEKAGFNPYRGSPGLDVAEIHLSDDLKSLNEVHALLGEADSKINQSETALMASSVPSVSDNSIEENFSLTVGVDKFVEEHTTCLEDMGLDELANKKNRISESLWETALLEEGNSQLSGSQRESGLVEEVNEREAAASEPQSPICSTMSNDYPRSEVSHTVPNSHLGSKIELSLDFVDAAQFQSPLGQSGVNANQDSFQESVENQVSDATLFPMGHITEETMLQEKIQLPPDQIDPKLLDSGEISSDFSLRLPNNQHQLLDQDDHKGENISALSSSLVNCSPPVSQLPGLRNNKINVSGHPTGSLGFMFPPSNIFSEPSHSNPDESPPLPPLPPVQWMGKLQHMLSTTERDTMKHKELFPQEISPPTASNDDVSSSVEDMNDSQIQTVAETTSLEFMVDQNSSSLETGSMHDTVGHPPKIENKQRSSSSLEADAMHETIDLPPKIQNKPSQLIMPATSQSELAYPAEEDAVAHGIRTVKLPRPRNPLIDEVVALDKSKLRKVTEQVRPQVQKTNERDPLLEQIRAQSFNLKPVVASRPSIQGPKTNLKVAAMLNAIRQANTGSDEDEDNWSDS